MILDEVRAACRAVAERARRVRIRGERLPAYAQELAALLESAPPPSMDPETHRVGRGEETVAFVLTLDAVNFGSGWFPHIRKRPGASGYFTVAGSLRDRFASRGPFSAGELRELGLAECAAIFGQEGAGPAADELMALFARALNDLGAWLRDRFDGRWMGPVEAAGGSAERLAELLAQMPLFRDVARHESPGLPAREELRVPFYKRAQIAGWDFHLAFGGAGPGRFGDLDRLTIFADNVVPHVLRTDGILAYDDALAAAIRAEEPIPAGSPEEVEIRACAVHAAERIVELLGKGGRPVTAAELDYLLWQRGRGAAYKARPRHRTRTAFY